MSNEIKTYNVEINRINIQMLLFLGFLFFLPYLKFSVPVPPFYLTISDICLLAFIITSVPRIKKYYTPMLLVVIFFLFSQLLSFPLVINYRTFFVLMLPWVFGVILVYSLMIIHANYNKEKFYKLAFIIQYINLVLICLFSYLNLIFDYKYVKFYGNGLGTITWRYNFATNNPNQLMIYTCCTLMCLFLINKYFKNKYNNWLILILPFLVGPTLESGSRSGLATYLLVAMLIFFNSLLEGSFIYRVFMSGIIVLLISGLISNFDKLSSLSGEAQRAVQIVEMVAQQKGLDTGHGQGTTGESHEIGMNLFYKYPITGVGLGQVHKNYNEIEIHSGFIGTLAETGIIGFFGFTLLYLLFPIYLILINKNTSRLTKTMLFFMVSLFYLLNYTGLNIRERWMWFAIGFLLLNQLDQIYKENRQ
jgi:hypothetical protein